MPKAGLLCALASRLIVPVRIHTFTGQVWQTKIGVGRFLLRMMDMFVVRLNTVCFTDSASQSQFLLNEGIGFQGGPLPVILKGSLGGVDLSKLAIVKKDLWRAKVKGDLRINNDHLVVGYLARKTMDKGALLILEAFSKILKRIPNVTLLFVGPDDSNGALDAYKAVHPNWRRNVIEMNEVANHEEYLAVFDVLCLPSYREGFGSIVIDAAALAIPCVGSRIPGLVDAIEDTVTGLLFCCGDIDDLCEKLVTLLQDRPLLHSYGVSALSRVKRYYDSEVISRSLENKYRELLVQGKHF
jgi:glycosyltransferase involved in cell wall biosynthesis